MWLHCRWSDFFHTDMRGCMLIALYRIDWQRIDDATTAHHSSQILQAHVSAVPASDADTLCEIKLDKPLGCGSLVGQITVCQGEEILARNIRMFQSRWCRLVQSFSLVFDSTKSASPSVINRPFESWIWARTQYLRPSFRVSQDLHTTSLGTKTGALYVVSSTAVYKGIDLSNWCEIAQIPVSSSRTQAKTPPWAVLGCPLMPGSARWTSQTQSDTAGADDVNDFPEVEVVRLKGEPACGNCRSLRQRLKMWGIVVRVLIVWAKKASSPVGLRYREDVRISL